MLVRLSAPDPNWTVCRLIPPRAIGDEINALNLPARGGVCGRPRAKLWGGVQIDRTVRFDVSVWVQAGVNVPIGKVGNSFIAAHLTKQRGAGGEVKPADGVGLPAEKRRMVDRTRAK